jgi:chemotaxis protein histidine kinase CheA
LIQDLGGRLRIETEPTIGTRVIIELPAVQAAPGNTSGDRA